MLRSRGSLLVVSLWVAACTGSQNQVFTQLKSNTHVPVAGSGADAGVPADSGHVVDDEDAGTVHVNVGLDPDAEFVWTETQPGHPGACEPGTYAGSFQCTFDAQGEFQSMQGSIEITLGPGPASTKLAITDGRALGFSNGTTAAFSSSLEGELDCADAHFTAQTKDSKTFAFPSGFEGKLNPMSIDGVFDGDFDAEALMLQGDVLLTTSGGWKCAGKFHAQLSR